MVTLKNTSHPAENNRSYSYIDGRIKKLGLLEGDNEKFFKKSAGSLRPKIGESYMLR